MFKSAFIALFLVSSVSYAAEITQATKCEISVDVQNQSLNLVLNYGEGEPEVKSFSNTSEAGISDLLKVVAERCPDTTKEGLLDDLGAFDKE